jgi:hypothetical protein
MRASSLRAVIGLAALLAARPCPAAESFADLARHVPDSANALLAIDVDALQKAPGRVGDALGLPAGVERLVVAAQINPTTLEHVWKVGVAATRGAVTQDRLAKAEGGAADTVALHEVVLSPRNAYYAVLAPQVAGVMHPANRQALARWLKAGSNGPGPSQYLAAAAAAAGSGAPVVLAFDTADVFDARGLQAKLAKMKALAGRAGDVPRAAQALAGLKGIRLTVRPGAKLEGELRLDGDGAAALVPVAKALVLEALESMSTSVEDLDDWTARADGGAVVLSGPLTERGLRQLLCPLLSPIVTPAAHATMESAPAPADSKGQAAAASLKYYRSVKKLLDDLRQQKSKTYNASAQAYQKYAQQIDELPILGVDPELLKWGGEVAVTLRGLAGLAKATLSQKNVAAMNYARTMYQGSYNSSDGWGYQYTIPAGTAVDTGAVGQINNLMATAGANEVAVRNQTWNNIDTATAQVRRKMTEKYQVEF